MAADVLAGPIVRRTFASEVAVFLALSAPAEVSLAVYPRTGGWTGDGTIAGRSSRPPAVLTSTPVATRALGDGLHVVVVSATAPTGGTGMTQGLVHHYDVEVKTADGTKDMAALRLLSARPPRGVPLGYAEGVLPSVVAPADDVLRLRVFQGSCRKPHSASADAMPTLDAIIETTRDDAYARPQQLVLTGDQIYADDVAAALLHILRPISDRLFHGTTGGDRETFDFAATGAVEFTSPPLAPRGRQRFVREDGPDTGFSSSEGACHLLAFAEFCTMYLLAWSETLWPAGPLPDAATVLEVDVANLSAVRARLTALGELTTADPAAGAPDDAALRKLLRELDAQTRSVETFAAGVPRVRRALANVAVYMQCDDHEVTDDWFVDTEWTEKVLASRCGRQVMTNGLAAYAVFQAWGNTPARYRDGRGKALLDAVTGWRGADAARRPELSRLVGIAHPGDPVPAAERVAFHFVCDWPAHRMIVLDTRTHRGPRVGGGKLELIAAAELDDQVPPTGGSPRPPVTLLVSPPPVLGLPLVEENVQELLALFGRQAGVLLGDVETWYRNRAALQRLLDRLVDHAPVVVLSGDVHYAFTIACEWWRVDPGRSGVIVQLTASALHNDEQLALHRGALTFERLVGRAQRTFALWQDTSRPTPAVVTRTTNPVPFPWLARDEPIALEDLVRTSRPADAVYRLQFVRGAGPTPGTLPTADRSVGAATVAGDRSAQVGFRAKVARQMTSWLRRAGGVGTWLVGRNNLGEVTFDDVTGLRVRHTLWWRLTEDPAQPDGRPDARPLTYARWRIDSTEERPDGLTTGVWP